MSDDEHEEEESYSSIKTVLGGARRDQRWHLTDEVDVLTLLGSSRFDLRDVETSGCDVVEISVTCVLGVVDLVVPAGTMVVLDGTSFLASAKSRVAAGGGSHLPRLEVTATTILGRVRVRTRSDDETEPPEAPSAEAAPVDAATPPDEVDVPDPAPTPVPAEAAPVAVEAVAPVVVAAAAPVVDEAALPVDDDDSVAAPVTS